MTFSFSTPPTSADRLLYKIVPPSRPVWSCWPTATRYRLRAMSAAASSSMGRALYSFAVQPNLTMYFACDRGAIDRCWQAVS